MSNHVANGPEKFPVGRISSVPWHNNFTVTTRISYIFADSPMLASSVKQIVFYYAKKHNTEIPQ